MYAYCMQVGEAVRHVEMLVTLVGPFVHNSKVGDCQMNHEVCKALSLVRSQFSQRCPVSFSCPSQ